MSDEGQTMTKTQFSAVLKRGLDSMRMRIMREYSNVREAINEDDDDDV